MGSKWRRRKDENTDINPLLFWTNSKRLLNTSAGDYRNPIHQASIQSGLCSLPRQTEGNLENTVAGNERLIESSTVQSLWVGEVTAPNCSNSPFSAFSLHYRYSFLKVCKHFIVKVPYVRLTVLFIIKFLNLEIRRKISFIELFQFAIYLGGDIDTIGAKGGALARIFGQK